MNETTMTSLNPDLALACRLVRSEAIPTRLLGWLDQPQDSYGYPPHGGDAGVCESLSELLGHALERAEAWERHEAANADQWLTAICQWIAQQQHNYDSMLGNRLVSVGLLPLYRLRTCGSLRRERFHEGFEQARHRFSEVLILLGLGEELGQDWIELLADCERDSSPILDRVKSELGLDITSVARLARRFARSYEEQRSRFPATMAGEYLESEILSEQPLAPEFAQQVGETPQWAALETLWKLAEGVESTNGRMPIPRSWVDIPVPWDEVRRHWNRLWKCLQEATSQSAAATTSDDTSADVNSTTRIARRRATADDPRSNSSAIGHHVLSNKVAAACDSVIDCSNQRPDANSDCAGDDPAESIVKTLDDINGELRRGISSDTRQSLDEDVAAEEAAIDDMSLEALDPNNRLPKVFIAEIHSYTDPALGKVLRRQIALGQSQHCGMSFATLLVPNKAHDQPSDLPRPANKGMAAWQQALVDWMSAQPEIVYPYAFITSDGELALSVMEVDRSSLTRVLRQGLLTILADHPEEVSEDEADEHELSSAKYFAGIASVAQPGANFAPNQLVEASLRCLEAAKRQGKATIKSIEVY